MSGRKIVASIFGAMAAGLVGATVARLLQVAQEILPWWWPWPVIVGGILFIVALLLLVPLTWWQNIVRCVLGLPRWLRETYIWKFHGPVYTFKGPKMTFEVSQDEQSIKYTAKVSLSVKNRNHYPLRVIIEDMRIDLEQKLALRKLHAQLNVVTGTAREILLKPQEESTREVVLSWSPYNNPAIVFVDIYKPYRWRIKGVKVSLSEVKGYQELFKTGRATNRGEEEDHYV